MRPCGAMHPRGRALYPRRLRAFARDPATGAALRAFIFSELAEGQPYSVDFRPEGPILVDFSARSADFLDFSTHIQWHPRDTPQPNIHIQWSTSPVIRCIRWLAMPIPESTTQRLREGKAGPTGHGIKNVDIADRPKRRYRRGVQYGTPYRVIYYAVPHWADLIHSIYADPFV